MSTDETPPSRAGRARRDKRADVRRNEQKLLDAAAAVFVRSGIDAPVREIAAESGLGMGTIYRHFPTRADLVVAVFRHQLDALAAVADLPPAADTPDEVLRLWVHRFADFLVTKHGLAEALHSDQAGFEALHAEFVERLLPVLDQLLKASAAAGRTRADVRAYDFMLAIGNLCIGVETFPDYQARRMIDLLLAGLLQPAPAPTTGGDLT
ncbi:TetR/AcrR family transcriptional regulator [Streptomyces hygroscopicus subsp. hygroscopicus]|uniref:AcrR family transcriptional regulator n=1 Tax=Streptomyces demainii TaxID=588122 RepID=A0ABT9KP70_9ACTN|nr:MULTISPECIES: TetR/AcrR family transcriptional regulator [Streptomyces]MBW8092583.1 TetR/AcrR family transcriptional regulator [Streptomyces hygroscopicus subsp. hygroscopicus]MCO8306228.1 TetR/AcrR family transcriptional regulator [Streptomyces sp. RKCA744]MDP9610174.1 AcrR family transcriptional regulator [Streptomyces demainii]